MYSLSRLLSTFMPTDRMVDKVATSSHLVNYFSVYAIDRKRWKGKPRGGRPRFGAQSLAACRRPLSRRGIFSYLPRVLRIAGMYFL